MKRFVAVLCGLLVLPAYAEIVPDWYYEDAPEYTEEYLEEEVATETEEPVAPVTTAPVVPKTAPVSTPRNTATRSASRATPSTSTASVSTSRTNNNTSRAIASRNTVTPRAAVQTSTTATPNTVSNTATPSRAASTGTTTQTVSTRRATPATTTNAARAGTLTQTDTVNTPLYTGRVSVRQNVTTDIANTRTSTARIASSSTANTTQQEISTVTMEELAQLTEYCKTQYAQCMDNFCDIIDDNQGRCSCSSNIKNYEKTENALKQATEELQDVAQKIQYIGLTKDEIETLFTQTEAEAAMQGRTDNTQLYSDLNKIKNLIIEVQSGNATADTSMSLDLSNLLDFSFDSLGFDLNSLFGTNTNNSISNQRGADLYKTASTRCKTAVLDSCRAQGVDSSIITNSYDLEIDKQCIVYERELNDANTQMSATVRNAKSVLQKARLLVAQQKNQYDLRGCVTALDNCMQDDFVCGSDYENCLDPSGKFIVNGAVVAGSEPGVAGGGITSSTSSATGLYSVWNYPSNNAWGNGNLGAFITQFIGSTTPVSTNMVGFLQQKIGYNADSKNYGMCVSVLNKCQNVSYTNGTYNRANKVVDSYLQRVLTQIKAEQDNVLSSYAENCIIDVTSCLTSNGYSTTASNIAKQSATNACAALIRTCASVTGSTTAEIIEAATE